MGRIRKSAAFLAAIIAVVLCFGYVGVQQVYADLLLAPENLTVQNSIVNGGDTGEEFLYTINLNVKNWAAYGTTGKDTITCGHGDDYVDAKSGNDTLYGHAGDDYLNGGAGADTYYGGAGNDTIIDSIGNDVIYGGEGNDYLKGGGGKDTFCFGVNDGNDFIEDFKRRAHPVSQDSIYGPTENDSISISGISNLNQIQFSKSGNHLVITFTIGSGKVTVNNYFSGGYESYLILPDAGNTSYDLQTLTSGSLGTTSATVLSPLSPPATLPSGSNAPVQTGNKNIQYTTNLANAAKYEISNLSSGDTFSIVQTITNSQKERGWKLDNIWGSGSALGANIDLTTATASGSLSDEHYSNSSIFFQNSRGQCTVTFNANGHGSAPQLQTVYCNEKATKPADPSESGWIFGGWYTESECINEFDFNTGITDDIILYAKWTQDQPQVVVINPISKRLLQNNTGATPDMTFTFSFTQQSEWDGVSYVSASTPIADKSVTITDTSDRLTSDAYVGDLTDKKLLEGKVDNVLTDFAPTAAGTYCYLVKENVPNPQLSDVTYTA